MDGEEAKLQATVKGVVDATHISRQYFEKDYLKIIIMNWSYSFYL